MLCAHAEHVWVEDLAVQEVMQEGMTGSVFLKMVVLGLQLLLCDIHVGRNNKDTESLLIFSLFFLLPHGEIPPKSFLPARIAFLFAWQ